MFAKQRLVVACLLVVCITAAADARVISYAPYSDRASLVALQHRLNRHFVLVEGATISGGPGVSPLPPVYGAFNGQVVVYDSKGLEEPRVVFPQDGTLAGISMAAVRENGTTPAILIETNANFEGKNPQNQFLFLLSADGGTTWKR